MAVSYIHSQGFIHSSLSPHNIYLDESGNASIDDLELSLIVQKATSLSELKSLLDEPFYASIEQLQLQTLDTRSETYSFGAVLYHMVTGAPPFSDCDGTFETVLQRKLLNQVIPPRQLNPAISPELQTIILRSLQPNPDERYADIPALHSDLKRLVDRMSTMPDTPSLRGKLQTFFSWRPT